LEWGDIIHHAMLCVVFGSEFSTPKRSLVIPYFWLSKDPNCWAC